MARSMIKRRQEAERERIAAFEVTLRGARRVERLAPDFDQALQQAVRGFAGVTVRELAAWRPKLKTRDPARLRLAAARHLFAVYPVPFALEQIWIGADGLEPREAELRKRWYVVAARGRSLWKEEAKEWLSRKEVHWFLNPPGELGFDQAFWCAVARSCTDDLGVALRIAHSKIARTPRGNFAFWREAVRFFCVNPTTLEEMDDLCDYLAAALERDRAYSVKGRTLGSLRRQMREWHRELEAVARIEAAMRRQGQQGRGQRGYGTAQPAANAGRWDGSPLADWSWQPSDKGPRAKRQEFVVTQLNTATELVAESSAMRHCVSGYANACIMGRCSIWSLRRRAAGRMERLLTIELDLGNRAVQVRGFANRLAEPDERKVLDRWAKARGVALVA